MTAGRGKGRVDVNAFSYAGVAGLDPGIAGYVNALRGHGIETFESCQGGKGHAYAEPTVRFHGGRSEGMRALAVALMNAWPVASVRRTWPIIDGEATGPYWEMTFWVAPNPRRAGSGRSKRG